MKIPFTVSAIAGHTTLEARSRTRFEEDKWQSEKGLYHPEQFAVWYGGEEIGEFTLAPMPGCCGIVVSTATFLNLKWRGQHHVSTAFHKLKQEVARTLGYNTMIATVELRNIPELVGACKNGWKSIFTWRNNRTSHDLGIIVKEI